jgi:hypothetical protein
MNEGLYVTIEAAATQAALRGLLSIEYEIRQIDKNNNVDNERSRI